MDERRDANEAITLCDGRILDPGRLRSEGPLDAAELAAARAAGLSLAYDPVLIGWVTAACRDDVDPWAEDFTAVRDAPAVADAVVSHAASRRRQAVERFHDRARSLLRRDAKGIRDEAARVAALWSLAEVVTASTDDVPDTERLSLLRTLQSEAQTLIAARPDAARRRAARRHRALVDGHDFVLRAWTAADRSRFRELLDDPRVWEHLPERYPDPLDDELAEQLIAFSNEGLHHEVRAIERGGRVVGQVRMLFDHASRAFDRDASRAFDRNASPTAGDAEISYWLGAEVWGQGIASAVIPLFTLLSFQKRPLASIYARVDPANVASLRALEKAGYRDEGDLATRADGGGRTRILRCHRSVYLDPDEVRRRARSWREWTGVGMPERAPIAGARPAPH